MFDEEELHADSPDEGGNSPPRTPKSSRRRRGELSKDEKDTEAKRKVKHFSKKWLDEPEFKGWLAAVPGEPTKARCKACNANVVAGRSELLKHAATSKHKKNVKTLQGVKSITDAFQDNEKIAAQRKLDENVKTAEIKMASFFCEHNISLMSSDHLVELAKACFPDSKIAQDMTLDRTKCTAIVRNVLGTYEKEEIAKDLRVVKFSVLVDESTDRGSKKNLCVVVQYISPKSGKPLKKC